MGTHFGRVGLALLLAAGCGGPEGPLDGAVDASFDAGRDASLEECAVDGDCDDGSFCTGVETCAPTDEGADARGCVPGVAACPSGGCDEEARTCPSDCVDEDGDGHLSIPCGGDDCDDDDAGAYPGNVEVCDATGHDEDCDPRTFGVRDLDGDDAPDALCCNESSGGTLYCGDDCDDARADTHPGATEACDGQDDDCDGVVDEAVMRRFWPDEDEDGFGDDAATPTMGCAPPGLLFAERAGDCDDANSFAHRATAPEVCDGEDNDCDDIADEETSVIPWYVDADRDGWGDSDLPTVESCPPIADRVTAGGDCDDAVPGVNPGVPETCNGRDDDCDDMTDEGVGVPFYRDADMDGHGDATTTMMACPGAPPPGYVASNTDCDDGNATVYPGAPELCDLIFNDCAAGTGARPEEDDDGDRFGDRTLCDPSLAGGGLRVGPDCDDTNDRINPMGIASATPFCPDNLVACSPCPGVARDRCGAPGCTCATGTVEETYDQNCNGVEEAVASVAACGMTLGCSTSCTARSGFTTAPSSASCGERVSYTNCRCRPVGGMQSICDESLFGPTSQSVPCR